MMDAVTLDRVAQRAHDVLLADDLVEPLGTMAAIQRGLRSHPADTTDGFIPLRTTESSLAARCETAVVMADTQDILAHGRRIAELERKVSELYKRLGQEEPTGFGSDDGFAEPPSVVAVEDPRLIELLQAGKDMDAIKLYRELTGVGLAEAKDAVDQLKATHWPTA